MSGLRLRARARGSAIAEQTQGARHRRRLRHRSAHRLRTGRPRAAVAVEAEISYGRCIEVADVARAVAWVASEEADYVVGSTIFLDGGMMLYPRFA
jgi:NAD(P)-dependent dehydrogenase (short-subunit alcohol dehydrogenase family)